MAVGREVGGNPIDDHANPRLMKQIDKLHEVMRRTEAAGRSEVARRLIAPRAVERELVDRHQLDVRVPEFLHVVDQERSQLAVVEELTTILRSLPRPEMDFVNRDRLLVPVHRLALVDPCAVAPRMAVQVADNRRALRGNLAREGVRVDLLQQMAIASPQCELVSVTLLESWNESPPNAVVAGVERVATVHPRVQITQD